MINYIAIPNFTILLSPRWRLSR